MPDSNPDETEEERKRRLALAGGGDSQQSAVPSPPPQCINAAIRLILEFHSRCELPASRR